MPQADVLGAVRVGQNPRAEPGTVPEKALEDAVRVDHLSIALEVVAVEAAGADGATRAVLDDVDAVAVEVVQEEVALEDLAVVLSGPGVAAEAGSVTVVVVATAELADERGLWFVDGVEF